MKVFNFQDPTHKADFGTSCGRTVFQVGNQHLKILRILVLVEILLSLEISGQFERHSYVQLNTFPAPTHKKCFSIYDPVTIGNFSEKLTQNKYICVGF